jgi:hypothetical protein
MSAHINRIMCVSVPQRRSGEAARADVEFRAPGLFSYFAIDGGIKADERCLTISVAFVSETTTFRPPQRGVATEMKMKKIFAAALPVLALSVGLGMASVNTATAQGPPVWTTQAFPVCFQGDTMQKDGGSFGSLGARKCSANASKPYDANALALYAGGRRSQ